MRCRCGSWASAAGSAIGTLGIPAATVNLPAIVLSGGPMNNGWHNGERTGSGTMPETSPLNSATSFTSDASTSARRAIPRRLASS